MVLIYPFYLENIHSSSHLPIIYLNSSLFLVAVLLSIYHNYISIYILFDKEGEKRCKDKNIISW